MFSEMLFLAPMPPLGSYRIPSLILSSRNGRPEFTPFFPSGSLLLVSLPIRLVLFTP